MWQAPAEDGCADAQGKNHDGAYAHRHKDVYAPKRSGDNGADDGCAGVEMFHKNIWSFAGEEVADYATTYAGEHAYENCEVWVAGAHAGVYAEHGEDGKPH